jgi:hypothetical protein
MLSLAIYTNSKSDIQIIRSLAQSFVQLLGLQIFDLLLFSDNLRETTNYNIAILSTFYMEFYKDYLIFMSVDDYLAYRSRLLTKHVFLYVDSLESLPENIDRNLLKEFKCIFTKQNNTISVVKL